MADPAAFVTVAIVRRRVPDMATLTDDEIQERIEEASQLILDERPNVDGLSPVTLRRVVLGMLKRGSAAAEVGVESVQAGAGPFQETFKYSNPMGDLYLTKGDRKALGIGRQRAFEIDPLAGTP